MRLLPSAFNALPSPASTYRSPVLKAQESKTSVTHADNQPLYALVPQVPMLPSRNLDYPDALIRRLKEPKGVKGRKSAAGAGGDGEGGLGDGQTADGAAAGEAVEEDGTVPVPPSAGKKAGKGGKAKARKSGAGVAADVGPDGAADSTRSELAGHGKIVRTFSPCRPLLTSWTLFVDASSSR